MGCSRSKALLACLSFTFLFEPVAAQADDTFVRGDVDESSRLDVTDAIRLLQFLFREDPGGVTCQDAADADDDGAVSLSDPIFILSALFRAGPLPSAPFPECGVDPTEDGLGCEASEICGFPLTFFGRDLAADGVFFVIDRSGTMQGNGELQRIKLEVIATIAHLREETSFGVVFFDHGILRFPEDGIPARATDDTKETARGFVQSAQGGFDTCPLPGLRAALDMARVSAARRDIILYASDGGATCSGADETQYQRMVLATLRRENLGAARIHTFKIVGRYPEGDFLQALAALNGGTYTLVR